MHQPPLRCFVLQAEYPIRILRWGKVLGKEAIDRFARIYVDGDGILCEWLLALRLGEEMVHNRRAWRGQWRKEKELCWKVKQSRNRFGEHVVSMWAGGGAIVCKRMEPHGRSHSCRARMGLDWCVTMLQCIPWV